MTSRPPTRRLVDVLQRNSKQRLEQHAAELAAANAAVSAEALQTRFLRNSYLIAPRALCLLPHGEAALARHGLFAIYKPPFCPMRRREASTNYHKVSVESFVAAVVRGREVATVLQRTLRPSELKLRVWYDLDGFASGPVVVSVSDRLAAACSLQRFTMTYDVLVAGHMPITEVAQPISTAELFPDVAAASGATQCAYTVRSNAYYRMHASSLLHFTITAPPTPSPPRIETYVRTHLHTFVLGDPYAVEHMVHGVAPVGMGLGAGAVPATGMMTLRGDCDFPRVFTHLREVRVAVDPPRDAPGGSAETDETVCFHCRRCVDPLLHTQRPFGVKGRQLSLLDGSWTPAAEDL